VAFVARAALAALAFTAALAAAAPPLRVVATTADVAAIAAAVGGDLVVVDSIVPPGADAEAFEPRPGDLDKLKRADAVVRVGLGYDYWLDALTARAGNRRLVRGADGYADASTGVPLLEIRGENIVAEQGHAHGYANPHYWLDPQNALIVSAGIAEMLVRLAPAERAAIVANRERFVERVSAALARWREALAPYAGAKLIAYHNSWPYFARRFRLDFVAFVEPKAGVAPSPAHLAHLIADGRRMHAEAIVHEPYEPQDASRFVASKLGVPVVNLAVSVGDVPEATDYIALIDHDVTALAAALSTGRR
jgi:ABC-type Zn uptake system ZnuABC Zn-binding protein ZnuA